MTGIRPSGGGKLANRHRGGVVPIHYDAHRVAVERETVVRKRI